MITHRLLSMAARAAACAAVFYAGTAGAATDATRQFWQSTQSRPLPTDAPQVSVYRPLLLDVAAIRAYLADARRNGAAFELAIPQPGGDFADFLVADSHTLPPALQAKYPGIVSLAGSDASGRKVRVDVGPNGLQAMVFENDSVWVVRPETNGASGNRYMSFRRADLALSGEPFKCGVHDAPDPAGHGLLGTQAPFTQTGVTQRVFRAAVAANHNYVGAVCAGNVTVACGLAEVVQAMNRVNQVYETDFAVHMTLVDNNDLVIYPTATGDPYSNNGNALDQNTPNLDAVIGNENYDIGHVFTTGSGGVALLGVTCENSDKGGGTTGLGNPTGDAFYIDYVAHEMGHQYGGNHTFNSTAGACGGGNRVGSAAYEPGSGSTIMAYAGICSADDLQPHSDPYFHAKSLEEINTRLNGAGGACAAATTATNAAPVIDTASLSNGYTIPMQTPFAMSGSATDADGDAITYDWEQYDRGPATTLAQGDTGAGAIFRSFNPTTSGARIFPKIETVLGAAFVPGETFADTTRNLNFRLTVRDNHDAPGTPQFGASQSADVQIHVTTTAGPFAVTRPNTATTWGRGESHAVKWEVAGTDVAPVACANVDIALSVDGGATWPDALATGVPNSGSALVTVPNEPDSSQARVRVTCADNIFFDVSNVNFSIAATGIPDPDGPSAGVSTNALTFTVEAGANATQNLDVANTGPASTTLAYTITEAPADCASTSDVPWLSATPTSGSVTGGTSAPIAVAVDASALSAGTQTANLCVGTDDPVHALIVVAVSLTVTAPANDEIFKNGFDGAAFAQPIADPSFEATPDEGAENPNWTSLDTNPGGAQGSVFYSTDGSQVPAHTGNWTAWFGGWGGGEETQTFSQSVTIASGGTRFLNYWRFVGDAPDVAGTLTISLDGTAIDTTDISTLTADADFVVHSIDLSAHANGAAHTIEFRYEYTDAGGTGIDGDIFIDDVTIDEAATRPQLRPATHAPSPSPVHPRKPRR